MSLHTIIIVPENIWPVVHEVHKLYWKEMPNYIVITMISITVINSLSLSLSVPVSEKTYTVLSGTLNPSLPYHTSLSILMAISQVNLG